ARTTMGKRKSHLRREKGFIYYHCQRVANLSLNLRKQLYPDQAAMDDIMYVGALFHDVTKGIEPHHETGVHLVKQLLQEECKVDELEIVATIIAQHNNRHLQELPYYIKIVQDADILDHFGSMEIWLKFIYSAY